MKPIIHLEERRKIYYRVYRIRWLHLNRRLLKFIEKASDTTLYQLHNVVA
jgi:hypothetical protein